MADYEWDRQSVDQLLWHPCKNRDKSYIKDLSQVALGVSDPASWNAFSATNRDNMEQMIAASIQLRDLIETDIQNTANDLEAQRLATSYAFRNRIHEVR